MPVIVLSSEQDASPSADLVDAMRDAGRDVVLDAHGPIALNEISGLGHDLADKWRRAVPVCVIAHGWQAGLATQIALQGKSVPVLQRFSSLAGRAADPKRARLETALARTAARVIATHAGQVEQLVSLGVRRPDIRVVPHGVDLSTFSETGTTWPRPHGRRVVTAVSAADPAAIAAFVHALPALPGAEFVVIGLIPAQAAGESLLQLARRRGVADRLSLTGPLALEERAALLRSSDVAFATTAEDSAASFVLQAMACGVPVVARGVGSAADAVADTVTGVLVSAAGGDVLADAVRAILSDEVRRESLGLAAVDRARARYNWHVAAAATGRIIDEVSDTATVVTLPRQDAGEAASVGSRS